MLNKAFSRKLLYISTESGAKWDEICSICISAAF